MFKNYNKVLTAIPISTKPPKISAFFPNFSPSFLPKIKPIAEIKNVAIPIHILIGIKLSTPENAIPIPAAPESMLSAIDKSKSENKKELLFKEGSSSSLLKPSFIILPPTTTSKINAIQTLATLNKFPACRPKKAPHKKNKV